MDLTPKAHTAAVLKRMNLASSNPGNLDRGRDASGDNYGLTSARSSDSSSFQMDGAPRSPHMGRPGRASGGRITGQLIRTRRTPEEAAKDVEEDNKTIDALAKDRDSRKKGGRIGRQDGGALDDQYRAPSGLTKRETLERQLNASLAGRAAGNDLDPPSRAMQNAANISNPMIGREKGGRVDRAHGGRTKGKTTVNVIIGGQKSMSPPAPAPMPPPPMAGPGPVGPPRPPMPPPGMMPPGGAPPGMAGGPPPGGPPMLRARGGRIGKAWGGGMPQPGGMGGGSMGSPAGGQVNWPGGQPPSAGGTPPAGGWGGQGGLGQIGQGIQQAIQAWQQNHPGGQMGQGAQPGWPPQGGQGAGQGQGGWNGQGHGGWDRDGDRGQWGGDGDRGRWGGDRGQWGGGGGGMGQGAPAATPTDSWAQRPVVMATGGRIEVETPGKHSYPTDGTHSFGKGGTPSQASFKRKYGGGSGMGRMEIARKEK